MAMRKLQLTIRDDQWGWKFNQQEVKEVEAGHAHYLGRKGDRMGKVRLRFCKGGDTKHFYFILFF